jgi:ABC-type glycerol-3-phosphate transport system substrate-binding protein
MIVKSRISPSRQNLSNAGGVIKAMQGGAVSITTNGDWNFKPLSDPSIPLSWDVSYLPRSPKTKKTASMANLRGISLVTGSKVPEQTWQFMAYTVRKEVQNQIPTWIQEVPARLDSALEVYADPQKAGPPPNRKALTDSIKAIFPIPAHDYAPSTNLGDAWTPLLNDMWDGKVTVEEGLRRMQEDVQKVVDQYKK